LAVALSRQKRKLTYEEWLSFPTEEGTRSELIDGEVWVTALPSPRHQRTCRRLLYVFETFLRAHGGGEILPPVNVRLADDQGFGPDLTFVHEWGDDPMTYHGPPPLVIEIVSDARRDRIKRARYERYGVPEYWAVIPEAEQIQVFRLQEGRYGSPTVVEAPGSASPSALPDLAVDLGEVFAD
jgi:Uma2 family endonuclease